MSATVAARELAITNQRGLHARASAKFVKCAEAFDAEITVTRDGMSVPATSIMGLMMLGAAIPSNPVHRPVPSLDFAVIPSEPLSSHGL